MSNYYMFWYRQGPRGTLDWIWRQVDNYGEGFQGRFKGSVVSSQNRLTLQIQAAKQGDEVLLWCQAYPGAALQQSGPKPENAAFWAFPSRSWEPEVGVAQWQVQETALRRACSERC